MYGCQQGEEEIWIKSPCLVNPIYRNNPLFAAQNHRTMMNESGKQNPGARWTTDVRQGIKDTQQGEANVELYLMFRTNGKVGRCCSKMLNGFHGSILQLCSIFNGTCGYVWKVEDKCFNLS